MTSFECELCGRQFDDPGCECKIINQGRVTIVCKGCLLGGDRGCKHTLNDCDQIYDYYRAVYLNQEKNKREYLDLKNPKGWEYTCRECGIAIEFDDWVNYNRTCGSHGKEPEQIPKPHIEVEELIQEAMAIIHTGEVIPFARKVLDKLHAGDDTLKLVNFLCCLSAGLPEKMKLHSLNVGKSQRGKSHVQRIQKYFFPDHWIAADGLSSKYLYYKCRNDEYFLQNKILFINDLTNVDTGLLEVVKAVTDGDEEELTHRVVNTKTREPEDMTIRGLPVVLCNTIEVPEDTQNANRFIIGNVDESYQQAERFVEYEIKTELNKYKPESDREVLILKIIVTEILKEQPQVLIPYFDKIKPETFLKTGQFNLYKIFKKFINVIAYANRHMRNISGPHLIAEHSDFDLAKKLFAELYQYQLSQVSDSIIKVVEYLEPDTGRTVSEIAEHFKISTSACHKRLQRAGTAGLARWERITRVIESNGHEREINTKDKIWFRDLFFDTEEIKILDMPWKSEYSTKQSNILSSEPA